MRHQPARKSFVSLSLPFILLAAGLAFFSPREGQAQTVTSGSLTLTVDGSGVKDGALQMATLDWLSDASGNVVATTNKIEGTLERFVFIPDDGATSPTANYDVVVNDVNSIDVLSSKGANLSQSATTQHNTFDASAVLPMACKGTLTLSITNAGNANGGVIRIYWRE